MEKYSRGWRGAPAKGVGRETGARVQIPLSPLKKMKWTDHFYSTDSFHFFVPKNHGPDRAWKNFFKKIKKSCWQRRDAVITYRSCRAWQKNADNEDEDLPCRLRKNISNLIWVLDRNATLNIFLYIWGHKWTTYAVHDQRSYLMDRAGKTAKLRKFRGHWIVRMIWAIERSASILRTTQFSKRIKMESQVHFDLENFFRIKILNVSEET